MDVTPERAAAWAEILLAQIENEFRLTRRVIGAIPPEQSEYAPAHGCMPARQLAAHIAYSELFFLEGVARGEFVIPNSDAIEALSLAEILQHYERAFPEALEAVRRVTPEQLAEPMLFLNGKREPRVYFLDFMTRHSIHHRGQLTAYLRPMGARVPSVYGASRDARERAAQQPS